MTKVVYTVRAHRYTVQSRYKEDIGWYTSLYSFRTRFFAKSWARKTTRRFRVEARVIDTKEEL